MRIRQHEKRGSTFLLSPFPFPIFIIPHNILHTQTNFKNIRLKKFYKYHTNFKLGLKSGPDYSAILR